MLWVVWGDTRISPAACSSRQAFPAVSQRHRHASRRTHSDQQAVMRAAAPSVATAIKASEQLPVRKVSVSYVQTPARGRC